MSSYQDFVNELPRRIKYLVETYYEIEVNKNDSKEVTLLISFAMPLFCISGESLKRPKEGDPVDSKIEKIKGNILSPEIKESTWLISGISTESKLGESKILRDCQGGEDLISSKKQAYTILKILRNALAHGNIQFETYRGTNSISRINFWSRKNAKNENDGYQFCTFSTAEFKRIIVNVCDELITNKWSTEELYQSIDSQEAAYVNRQHKVDKI
jgi:hypothetical protein